VSATAPVRARSPERAAPHPARQPVRPSRASRPPLRLVEAPPSPQSRVAFVVLVGGILGSGLVVLLLLHTLAAQDGFTLHRLQRQTAALADTEQGLALANQQAAAPGALARRARALGMVPTGELKIVRRRDGRVVGIGTAAYVPAPAKPAPAPSPAAAATTPAAAPTATATATASTASPAPTATRKKTPRRH
jgi:hypothetical protein